MADTTLTQTGAEVQAAINKAEKLPTVTGSDNGKTLQVDSNGNFVANIVNGGFNLTLHGSGANGDCNVYFKDGTSTLNVYTGTFQNVVAIECNYHMASMYSGYGYGTMVTYYNGDLVLVNDDNVASLTGKLCILLTDVEITGLSMGGGNNK